MEKKTASKIPLWKLIITLQAMLDEGYTFTDITIENELVISLKGYKVPPEETTKDLNQLSI